LRRNDFTRTRKGDGGFLLARQNLLSSRQAGLCRNAFHYFYCQYESIPENPQGFIRNPETIFEGLLNAHAGLIESPKDRTGFLLSQECFRGNNDRHCWIPACEGMTSREQGRVMVDFCLPAKIYCHQGRRACAELLFTTSIVSTKAFLKIHKDLSGIQNGFRRTSQCSCTTHRVSEGSYWIPACAGMLSWKQ